MTYTVLTGAKMTISKNKILIVSIVCILPLQLLGMNKVYPFIFHEERLKQYFALMQEKIGAKNFSQTQFTKQVIMGGNYVSAILSGDDTTPNNHVYNKILETPATYLPKISAVMTFLFTMIQSTGGVPTSWIMKLKDDTHSWRKFFIHNLYELTWNTKEQYIFKASGDHDQIGALIIFDRNLITHHILPHDDDEILMMPDAYDKNYLTIRPGKEYVDGWSNRILQKSRVYKIFSGVTNPTTLLNGTLSLCKKTYGGSVPKDGPICTEYLSDDIATEAHTIFSLLQITPLPIKLHEIYHVLQKQLIENSKIDKTTKQKVEAFLSYLRKNYNNLFLRTGNEIIFNKKWLATNAYLYELLNKTENLEYNEESERYYDILKQFRNLNDLIFTHNHNNTMVNIDSVWAHAQKISQDDFKKIITLNIKNNSIKEYLCEIIDTIKLAITSKTPHTHLLEQHFFDEDDLTIIKSTIDTDYAKNK